MFTSIVALDFISHDYEGIELVNYIGYVQSHEFE